MTRSRLFLRLREVVGRCRAAICVDCEGRPQGGRPFWSEKQVGLVAGYGCLPLLFQTWVQAPDAGHRPTPTHRDKTAMNGAQNWVGGPPACQPTRRTECVSYWSTFVRWMYPSAGPKLIANSRLDTDSLWERMRICSSDHVRATGYVQWERGRSRPVGWMEIGRAGTFKIHFSMGFLEGFFRTSEGILDSLHRPLWRTWGMWVPRDCFPL